MPAPVPVAVPPVTVNMYRVVGTSLYVAVMAALLAGMVIVVDDRLMLVTVAVSPVHLSNIFPVGAADADTVMTVPAAKLPDPVPLLTVSVYRVAGTSLYVAVMVTLDAGMVIVVDDKLMLVTVAVSPVHLSNIFPAGAAAAEMLTTVPATQLPEPVPPVTVNVYRVGGTSL